MRVNASSIHGTTASPFTRLDWGRATKKEYDNATELFLHVFDWPEDGGEALLEATGIHEPPDEGAHGRQQQPLHHHGPMLLGEHAAVEQHAAVHRPGQGALRLPGEQLLRHGCLSETSSPVERCQTIAAVTVTVRFREEEYFQALDQTVVDRVNQ